MKKFGVLHLIWVMLLCIGLVATGCTGGTDSDDDATVDNVTSGDSTDDGDNVSEGGESTENTNNE